MDVYTVLRINMGGMFLRSYTKVALFNVQLLFFIFALLIFSGLLGNSESIANTDLLHNTIHVDDDNVDGPWDGSVQHPYNGISQALQFAKDGDTLFVHQGVYIDNVIINKKVTLLGEDTDTTTILNENNVDDCISIYANDVSIQGFTITSESETTSIEIVGIRILENNVIVENNVIMNHYNGIEFRYAEDIEIYRNDIFFNHNDGISTFNCYLFWVEYNDIRSNGRYGISIGQSVEGFVEANYFQNQGRSGVEISESQSIHINQNIISNNFMNGIRFTGSSESNEVKRNTISYNGDFGIQFRRSSFNDIEENNIIENGDAEAFFDNCNNNWDNNYWNRTLPFVIITGEKTFELINFTFTWINVDWHPANEPYDIGG